MSRARHLGVLAGLALLLSGCGDQLDSRYGVTDRGSINGCAVLKQVLAGRSDLHSAHQLNQRLEDKGGLLVHVAREAKLPDEEVCTWVDDWLAAEPKRQAVIVLRDGNLTPWLCRRWAVEVRAEATRTPARAEALRAQAEALDQRAGSEGEDHGLAEATCDQFTLRRHAAAIPTALNGLGLHEVPASMRVSSAVVHAKAQALISVQLPGTGVEHDGAWQPWAVAIPVGDGGRLVVVADALPLLDGAQPDPAARRLLAALVDDIIAFHDDGRPYATWVAQLEVPGDQDPPNPLLALVATPPIAYVTWHLIALLMVLALSSAAWLGRREAPRDRRQDRFSRHVLALAARLRDAGQATWCARAIARVVLRHRGPAPALGDAASARAWLRTVAGSDGDAATHPVPATPRPAQRPP